MANTGKDLKNIIEILKKVNIFSETDDATLEKIAKRLKPLHLQKNETVITKGERGRTMYVIVKGVVNVHDRDHVFTTLTDGQAFGEYSLIDTELRSASVTGAEPTDLLRFDQEDFYALLSSSAGFAKGILKVLIARLRQLDIVQEQLASSNARIIMMISFALMTNCID
jgi:CRP-like cAMP-binding protein